MFSALLVCADCGHMPGSGFLCQFRTVCRHISHIPLCHNLFCPQKGRAADLYSATRPIHHRRMKTTKRTSVLTAFQML